eukprot:TRINITY_DN9540_c0_g1_i3.p1 TRINITY_DN9540_c0_g1~~TRINITY_DN9540_c0_g1_i3.p1  ORF type:complete len:246 (-),score=54.13 TRINITY_DN9540_c0_g1_i3:85-822(-)
MLTCKEKTMPWRLIRVDALCGRGGEDSRFFSLLRRQAEKARENCQKIAETPKKKTEKKVKAGTNGLKVTDFLIFKTPPKTPKQGDESKASTGDTRKGGQVDMEERNEVRRQLKTAIESVEAFSLESPEAELTAESIERNVLFLHHRADVGKYKDRAAKLLSLFRNLIALPLLAKELHEKSFNRKLLEELSNLSESALAERNKSPTALNVNGDKLLKNGESIPESQPRKRLKKLETGLKIEPICIE